MANFTDWVNGHHQELSFGPHYFQRCRSAEVYEGEKITFFANKDRTGGGVGPFYQGTYADLTFYGIPEYPGLILIEKTPLTIKSKVMRQYCPATNGMPNKWMSGLPTLAPLMRY